MTVNTHGADPEKMNPEVKALWVTALRSGEYEQGRGALIQIDEGKQTYCCLGVLCDLAIKAGVAEVRLYENENSFARYQWWDATGDAAGEWSETEGTLPPPVMTWAGLIDDDPVITSGGLTAVEANDSEELSFVDIAEQIEENL